MGHNYQKAVHEGMQSAGYITLRAKVQQEHERKEHVVNIPSAIVTLATIDMILILTLYNISQIDILISSNMFCSCVHLRAQLALSKRKSIAKLLRFDYLLPLTQ